MKTKLFGDRVQRVTTKECAIVYNEMFNHFIKEWNTSLFHKMQLTQSLSCKETHGDVDIVCELNPLYNNINTTDAIKNKLAGRILDYSRNTYIHSVIYSCERINKHVHVDFIINRYDLTKDLFKTRLQYFCYNDFSGILGIMSKKLNFKYGSEGFFYRYKDSKGNWHDIFLSDDLWEVGLQCLGYNPARLKFIKKYEDISEFIVGSGFFDSKYFEHNNMNQSDKKSYKRPVIHDCVDYLRNIGLKRIRYDDLYYVKMFFPEFIGVINNEIDNIEKNIKKQLTKYNGDWLMRNFNIPQGPIVGFVLNEIALNYNNESNEDEVIKFVNKILEVGKSCQL